MKLDTDSLRYIAALEKTTGAEVRDCFVDESRIMYVVKNGQLGMAIGKEGINVKKLNKALGKSIGIFEFSEDPVRFAKNFIGREENIKNVFLDEKNKGTKNIIIEVEFTARNSGFRKGSKKVQILKELLKRHHGINEVVIRNSG